MVRKGTIEAKPEIERDSSGRYAPGQSGNLRHGGEAAVSAIREGKPFPGLASLAEREVQQDLEEQGRAGLVKEAAIRLHTAMRLYWGAVQSAADQGDLAKLDSYCARFGWLAGAALRAWAQVKADAQEGDGHVIDLALAEARKAQNEQD